MIDENTVAVVAASCRAGTFSALTRDEHTDLVRSIILAYEAAKPVADIDTLVAGITPENRHSETEAAKPSPPMSTSGEMVERIAAYLKLRDEMVTDPDERTDDERTESAKDIAAMADFVTPVYATDHLISPID